MSRQSPRGLTTSAALTGARLDKLSHLGPALAGRVSPKGRRGAAPVTESGPLPARPVLPVPGVPGPRGVSRAAAGPGPIGEAGETLRARRTMPTPHPRRALPTLAADDGHHAPNTNPVCHLLAWLRNFTRLPRKDSRFDPCRSPRIVQRAGWIVFLRCSEKHGLTFQSLVRNGS